LLQAVYKNSMNFFPVKILGLLSACVGVVGLSAAFAVQPPKKGEAKKPELQGVRSLEVFADGKRLHMLLGEAADPAAIPVLSHSTSLDGGETWSTPVPVGGLASPPHGLHRGSDARIAAHGDQVVAAWTTAGSDSWGSGPIMVVTSNDGGAHWKPAANPADDGLTDGHNFLALNTDALGRFHLAWLDKRDGERGLRYSCSKDGGQHWEANHTAAPKTCECCWNSIAPLSNGGVAILFRDRSPRDMKVVTSAGGSGWHTPVAVGDFQWQFNACPHVGGALVSRSSASGDQLHAAVWTGAAGASGLYHLRSEDSGVTWTAPHKMNVLLAWHPALAVNAGGRLAAVWDTMAAVAPETWGSLSSDGGETWEAPVRLSAQDAPAAHPRVVAIQEGFRVFWTEEFPTQQARLRSTVFGAEAKAQPAR
jgi:hypothetical protein